MGRSTDVSWLRRLSGTILLKHYAHALTLREQLKIAQEFPEGDQALTGWRSGSQHLIISICLPLSGSFGAVGQRLRSELQLVKSSYPELIEASLQFDDCSASQWNAEAYRARVEQRVQTSVEKSSAHAQSATDNQTAQKPHFVMSAASPKIQRQLMKIHRNPKTPYHVSLNRLRSSETKTSPRKTLSLYQEADVLVGTLISDALATLKRRQGRTLPLNFLMITHAEQMQPAGRYLHKHRRHFANYRRMAVPKTCPVKPVTERRACLAERTAQWVRLVKEVETINRSSSPNEVIFFDVAPKEIVEFLKYLAAKGSRSQKRKQPLLCSMRGKLLFMR